MTKTETAKNLLKRVLVKERDREYYLLDGKMDGEFKSWWPNGQLFVHCYYRNGKFDGEYKSWDENGEMLEHYYYKNGVIVKVK